MKNIHLDSYYVDALQSFVNNEVIYNVSYFMGEFLNENPDMYYKINNLFMTEDEIIEYYNIDEDQEEDEIDYEIDEIRDRGEDIKEVMEWWLVTERLYNKLKNADAPTLYIEEYDFYVWGRTTTGQAIFMDYVILKIFDKNQ